MIDPVVVIIIAGCVIPLIWVIVTYNRFIRLKHTVMESWADIARYTA